MAVPNLWRTQRQRYRLQAEMCPVCSQAVFPPREICPHCHQLMHEATSHLLNQSVAEAKAFVLPAGVAGKTTPAPVLVGAD